MLSRREVSLLLFCLTLFIVAFNFESSVKRYAPSAILSFSASSLLGRVDIFREDGRRIEQYTDDLERTILGDWEVEERPQYELSPYGMTEDKQRQTWTYSDAPATNVLAHVPGYTVLENVFLVNGTILLVTDASTSNDFPKPEAILSTGLTSPYPPVLQDMQFVTNYQILQAFGNSVHRMPGASIFCFDHPALVDNYTFPALLRAYSVLELSRSPLPPADRLFFVNVKNAESFTTGFSKQLAKTALPFTNLFFAEDWDDHERTARPLFFDRVLLADRVAALHGAPAFDFANGVNVRVKAPTEVEGKSKKPLVTTRVPIEATDKHLTFAPPFAFPASPDWFAPIRKQLLGALALPGDSAKTKSHRAVTFVSTQMRSQGPRLRQEDFVKLILELKKMANANGWELHIVTLGDGDVSGSTWREHAVAAVNSNVMLGVHGDSLTSSFLMKQASSPATVIEFFPDGKYTNENEFITRAVGIDYIAWRNTKKYPRGSLPPISPPSDSDNKDLRIDVSAVIQTVKEQLRRR